MRILRLIAEGKAEDVRLYHLVPDRKTRALCGTVPGRSSAGWNPCQGERITCTRCQAIEERAK